MEYPQTGRSQRLITFNELRKRLGNRGRTTIYRDIDSGRLPRPVKIGSRLYWAEADIDAAIAALAG
jgi:prophage regulatory protein